MKQLRHGAFKLFWSAKVWLPGGASAGPRWIVVDIIDNHDVEPSVSIVIDHCDGCSPQRTDDSATGTNLAEVTVPVKEQVQCTEFGDQQVDETVVVDVASRGA